MIALIGSGEKVTVEHNPAKFAKKSLIVRPLWLFDQTSDRLCSRQHFTNAAHALFD